MTDLASETVHRLPHDPVHLYQLAQGQEAYYNPMGCGAFSTAMALSVYDRAFGSYEQVRAIFGQMIKVPFFGGTFEHQNAAVAHRFGYLADFYMQGTPADLLPAIDLGAPVILLVNPGVLGLGRHDVLLVGYSEAAGAPLHLFLDNTAVESPTQSAPPGRAYPGNQTLTLADLSGKWTGGFTPIFRDSATQARWRNQAQRG